MAFEARRPSVRRSQESGSRGNPAPLARARRGRPLADLLCEGTRSWDGRVAKFKAGSFLLAIQAGLPIVPVAAIGTRQVMPKGRLRTEPADVGLVIHDRIQPPAISNPTARDAKALADKVHDVVAATVDARQRAV